MFLCVSGKLVYARTLLRKSKMLLEQIYETEHKKSLIKRSINFNVFEALWNFF